MARCSDFWFISWFGVNWYQAGNVVRYQPIFINYITPWGISLSKLFNSKWVHNIYSRLNCLTRPLSFAVKPSTRVTDRLAGIVQLKMSSYTCTLGWINCLMPLLLAAEPSTWVADRVTLFDNMGFFLGALVSYHIVCPNIVYILSINEQQPL